LGGILRNLSCNPIAINSVEDHVHLLFTIARTTTLAQVVERLKTASAKWIKLRGRPDFSWQAGYGAFSIGPNDVAFVVRYIEGQEDHHKVVTFQDELRALLREAGIEFDERYLWE
jgi:putative transposase